jgi:hypothetical protein
MNSLQTAANLATIIEAIVVIVSVIFIWMQLKQQNKLTKVANTQTLVEISSPFNLELIKDSNMAALWVNGSKNYNSFNEVQKYQYKSLLIWWLIFHENIFYQKKESLLDDKIYNSWDYDLRFFIKKQNLKLLWNELKDAFQSEFKSYVTMLIEIDSKGVFAKASVG